MIALVKDEKGLEGYIVGFSSGADGEAEWEEVLVACANGKVRTYRAYELTFLGLVFERGLVAVQEAKRGAK